MKGKDILIIDNITEYIVNNKEWLFSGIGVFILSIVAGFITSHLFKKRGQNVEDNSYIAKEKRKLSLESCFLLIYASNDNDIITKARALNGRIIISTRKRSFMKDASPRESAIWQDAIDILLENGMIRSERKTQDFELYGLTGAGYKKGEELRQSMNVDTTKEPLEELNKEWI